VTLDLDALEAQAKRNIAHAVWGANLASVPSDDLLALIEQARLVDTAHANWNRARKETDIWEARAEAAEALADKLAEALRNHDPSCRGLHMVREALAAYDAKRKGAGA